MSIYAFLLSRLLFGAPPAERGNVEIDADELFAARTLREWITGARTEYGRMFFLDSGAPFGAIAPFLSADDVVIAPEHDAPTHDRARILTYSGQFTDPGDELFVGHRGVELQDYLAAAFVEVVGPTAVRFFDQAGWTAFLDDAELARRTGVFPPPLIDPRVALADRDALIAPARSEPPRAVRVDQTGRISLGMQGIVLGDVNDTATALSRPVPPIAALGDVVAHEHVASDLRDAPWLPRYLHAIELVKMLALGNGVAKVAGFGWSVSEDGRAESVTPAADPFIVSTQDGVVLADVISRRRQLLTPLTADVVSIVQTSASLPTARDRLAALHGIDTHRAELLCRDALDRLGVHSGGPRDEVLVGAQVPQ